MRLFSVRHEFPTEWTKLQGQTPGANQRFELTLNLREEHYSFWSQGRLNSVPRVDLFARSTKDPVPGSLDVFDKAGQNVATLAKNAALGNLLVGKLTKLGLPSSPIGDLWVGSGDRSCNHTLS